MISHHEQVITLLQATRSLPCRRRGRPTHVSTLYRWSTSGCRGVVLDSVQIGATRCTSLEALDRFFKALSFARKGSGASHVPAAKPAAVTPEVDKKLRSIGF